MPSSPRLPPSMRRHSSFGQPATASPTPPWTATTWWRRHRSWSTSSTGCARSGPVHCGGRHLPLARPLRGRSRAVPVGGRGRGVARAATRCWCTRPCCVRRVWATTSSSPWRRRRPRTSTARSRRPAGWPHPPRRRWRTSSCARGRRGRSRPARRRTRRCSAPWTPCDRRWRPSSPRTSASFSPASTSAPAATSSGSRAGWPTSSRGGCGTRRSPRPPSSGSASGRPWPACIPWSS